MSVEERIAKLEERLGRTEARLRLAEDHLEIIRLLSSYGPAVDSCASREAAELWTADGAYDVGGRQRVEGRDAIAAMYTGHHHVGMTKQGSSHLTATPRVTIDGDRAEAVAYSFVVLHGGGVEERFWIWAGLGQPLDAGAHGNGLADRRALQPGAGRVGGLARGAAPWRGEGLGADREMGGSCGPARQGDGARRRA